MQSLLEKNVVWSTLQYLILKGFSSIIFIKSFIQFWVYSFNILESFSYKSRGKIGYWGECGAIKNKKQLFLVLLVYLTLLNGLINDFSKKVYDESTMNWKIKKEIIKTF